MSILEDDSNRNYPLPEGSWKYYQEWHQVLMLHWKIDAAILLPLLPAGLELDTFDGEAWISIVPLTVRRMKMRGRPSLPYFEFDEISIRTYVIKDNIPGVFIFSVETRKMTAVLMGRLFTGISYVRSRLSRSWHAINSSNTSSKSLFDIRYSVKSAIQQKSELDLWLTDRHAMYQYSNGRLYRFDMHHKAWKLKDLFLGYKHIHYNIGSINVPLGEPDKLHFAKKMKVLMWNRTDVTPR